MLTYLKYNKLPEYGAMPTKVADKWSRFQTIVERKSPNISPHASDGGGDDAHDDEVDALDD